MGLGCCSQGLLTELLSLFFHLTHARLTVINHFLYVSDFIGGILNLFSDPFHVFTDTRDLVFYKSDEILFKGF